MSYSYSYVLGLLGRYSIPRYLGILYGDMEIWRLDLVLFSNGVYSKYRAIVKKLKRYRSVPRH